ncbi:hypothetical protein KQH60_09490 [Mycetohabitans sp. B8]|nr:hypothetical protein [Mycetohabitans sp. B8]MCG1042758.1 hypothetical protein [Mycetohabitans sp. B8]
MLGSALAVLGGNTGHSGVLLRPAIRQHWQCLAAYRDSRVCNLGYRH